MPEKLPQRLPMILASSSPRRAELLRASGISFRVQSANVDEAVQVGESSHEYVTRLAREKAAAVSQLCSERAIVLGADTIVVVENELIGKPVDENDASRMLRMLSGKWHEVLTGVALITPSEMSTDSATTRVKFASMSDQEIEWYVSSGEPADKAGAYAIQGLASRFVERIEGSYSNVVGLPVETVWKMVKSMGLEID
jgi:nucleoside triphosphate pyrophosphatase